MWPACYTKENNTSLDGGISLDHNHTHFLLVDDGTKNIQASDSLVEFQLQLESYISKKVEIGFNELTETEEKVQSWGNYY